MLSGWWNLSLLNTLLAIMLGQWYEWHYSYINILDDLLTWAQGEWSKLDRVPQSSQFSTDAQWRAFCHPASQCGIKLLCYRRKGSATGSEISTQDTSADIGTKLPAFWSTPLTWPMDCPTLSPQEESCAASGPKQPECIQLLPRGCQTAKLCKTLQTNVQQTLNIYFIYHIFMLHAIFNFYKWFLYCFYIVCYFYGTLSTKFHSFYVP